MYDVYDWAEVHRLHREGHSNSAIARRLGMSRTTVIRLLRYERRSMVVSSNKTFSAGRRLHTSRRSKT